jgi:hypothetical protein
MKRNNLENVEELDILEYLEGNYIGILLFIFAFVIIYFIDYINGLNAIISSVEAVIPSDDKSIFNKKSSNGKKNKKR